MPKISVVINTLNEEKNIKKAIKSVKEFADEIVVVDMESDDDTAKIAKKLGSKVYSHRRMGYVEPARNFAISKTKGDWILVLDADEETPKTLGSNLKEFIKNDKAHYYAIPRKNIIFNRWIQHSGWWPDYNVRFFKKGHVNWSEIIHSVPTTKGVGIDLPPEEDLAIIHHHYQSIEQFIMRLNRYTTVQAKELQKEKAKFKVSNIIKKPSEEFLSRYFAQEGYKDGVHGLVLALLQGVSELVVYAKLWELQKFKPKDVETKKVIKYFKSNQEDANYWYADTLIKNGAGLPQKIKRKLKIR